MANEETSKAASVEVHFAQRLAANEKKIRDRAMKKLRKWFELKSLTKKEKAFTEGDFLKIWKGLHYCLWMQDKPLLQEEMSAFISRLVHVFTHVDTTLLFIQVFLETEAREWHGIDRWRMDKFMMLFRNMLTQSLEFLKKQKWKKGVLTKFVDILSSKILTITEDKAPDGLKIHLADIYLDELEKVGSNKLSPDKVLKLLEPFTRYIQNSRNIVIVERVISRVFDEIIQQTVNDAMAAAEKQLENENSAEEENEDIDDEEAPIRLQFDFKALSDMLFQLGSSKDCVSKNRNMIYTLVKKFKDLEEGILPVEEGEEETGDVLSKRDLSLAVQQLESLETGKKKKRKKKKKKSQGDTMDDNSDNLSDKGGDAKKGKRKMEDETENKNPTPPKKKKGTNKGKENITENEKLSSVPPADSSKIGSKTTHIGLDTLALKKLKNQEKRKEITENPSEIGNSSSKKKKGNQAKKMKKLEAMQKGDNSVKSIETVSQGDNSGKTSQSPAKQSKNKQKQLNNSSLEIVDNDVRLSEQVIEVKNKRKRKSSQNLDVSVQEHNSVPTPSKEKTPKVKKNKVTKLNNSITEATMESERSGFAKFDKLLKTPPAFVRKSVSKFTTPKSAVKQKTLVPPSSCPAETKKKVIFNMKKNEALSFQESIQFSPQAFNPKKLPDHGIIKTPSPSVTRSKSTQNKTKRRASTGVIKRSKATDFF